MSAAWARTRFAEHPKYLRIARHIHAHSRTPAFVTKLLFELFEVRFNKGLTSQDHAIGKVANLATQAFSQGEFAILFVNDSLSGRQIKGRRLGLGTLAPAHKEVLAILPASFLPRGRLRLAKSCFDTVAGQAGSLGDRLCIGAIAIRGNLIDEL